MIGRPAAADCEAADEKAMISEHKQGGDGFSSQCIRLVLDGVSQDATPIFAVCTIASTEGDPLGRERCKP